MNRILIVAFALSASACAVTSEPTPEQTPAEPVATQSEDLIYTVCSPNTDYKNDSRNCGGCGHKCAAGFFCSHGHCVDQVYGPWCTIDLDCPKNGGYQTRCVANRCDYRF